MLDKPGVHLEKYSEQLKLEAVETYRSGQMGLLVLWRDFTDACPFLEQALDKEEVKLFRTSSNSQGRPLKCRLLVLRRL